MLGESNSISIPQQIQNDIDELYYQLISIFTGKCQLMECNSFLKNHLKLYLSGFGYKGKLPEVYYAIRNVSGDIPCMWFELEAKSLSPIKIVSDAIDKRRLILIPPVKSMKERLEKENSSYDTTIGYSLADFFMYPAVSRLGAINANSLNKCSLKMFGLETTLYIGKFFEMLCYDDDRIIDIMQRVSSIASHDYILYLHSDIKDIRFEDFGSLSTYMTDTFLRGSLFERSWFEKLG